MSKESPQMIKVLPILFFGILLGSTHAGDWLLKDFPYRATLRVIEAPNNPESGVVIELPDFGVERTDLADAVLIDPSGTPLTLKSVWHENGKKALFLGNGLKSSKDYYLYFGGKAPHITTSSSWVPKLGLFLENRSLGSNPKIDSWGEMQTTWLDAVSTNGGAFVDSIYTSGNPFGADTNYASHFSGWLMTPAGGDVILYTLSSDASFVSIDDRPMLEWPGVHGLRATEDSVKQTLIHSDKGVTKIDYYQAKIDGKGGASMLGWKMDGHMVPIPPSAWVHSGKSKITGITQREGLPVPLATVSCESYLGYGGAWLYDLVLEAPNNASPDWMPEWHFEDGTVWPGSRCERVMLGGKPQMVALVYRKGAESLEGVKIVDFPEETSAASVKDPTDLAAYLMLLSKENPMALSSSTLEAILPLLFDFANNDLTGKFAAAWLSKKPPLNHPLWLDAQIASIRRIAQNNPQNALEELQNIDVSVRQQYQKELSLLELDLHVFYLKDLFAATVAHRIAFDFPKSEAEEIANIRIGDLYRLTDRPQQCEEQYKSVQKSIADDTGGRKLPTMDRAYSITVENLLSQGLRKEANQKLTEWEVVHPMAKLNSDFLLLRARVLNSFGYYTEAIAELDSFTKMQKESPYEIDADFYRAEALHGLGRNEEARKIWNSIVTNYPRHELAGKCKEYLSQL